MTSNDNIIIKDASLTNSLNLTGYTMANNALEINREVLLSNYTPEILNNAWSALCQFIAKNYHNGKGTVIKGFGTFTYDNYSVNLEGTTNPFTRDTKTRSPVFIVSTEFNDTIKPGKYTSNGVVYYTQHQNNNVSHIKVNFTEISYAISISKEECANIIKHLLHHISESIRMKNFKRKTMPFIGELILNRNVLGVKFNDELVMNSRNKTQRYNFVKKNMLLSMDVSNARHTVSHNLINPYQSVENLRPDVSVLTRIQTDAQQYMKHNYGIDVNKIAYHNTTMGNNVYRPFSQNKSFPIKFINDSNKRKKVNVWGLKLKDLKLPCDVLETFEYFKGKIICNMKLCDKNGIGVINVKQCVDSIMNANMNEKLTCDVVKDIVEIYSKGKENVEYMKFITQLLKDCNSIVNGGSNNDKTQTQQLKTTSRLHNKEEDDANEKVSTTSNGNDNNTSSSNNQCNALLNKHKELEIVAKDLKLIQSLIPQLQLKYKCMLNQNISHNELNNILREFSITYSSHKLIHLLSYIDIPNINAFSLNDLFFHIKNTKILFTNTNISLLPEQSISERITSIYTTIRDIIYINGGLSFLFPNNTTHRLSKTEFTSLLKQPTSPYTESDLSALYDYIVKTDRLFTINDYNLYFSPKQLTFDSAFESNAMVSIGKEIEKRQLKLEQFFDCLCKYNINTTNKLISRSDFIAIMQKEKFNFTAAELDYIFTYMDIKKDNMLDKDEFITKVGHEQLPLSKMQCIIKQHKLDIEDLAHRMEIDVNNATYEKYTYDTFACKIRKIENTLSNEFIRSVFNSLKRNVNDTFVYACSLLESFDVFKHEHLRNVADGKVNMNSNNYIPSFKHHYITSVQKTISYYQLKSLLEDADFTCCGLLSADDYTRVFHKALPQFTDDEHIKFARITNMCDKDNNLKYLHWLNLIYHNYNQSDPFALVVNALIKETQSKFKGNIASLMQHITNTKTVIPISYNTMQLYLQNELRVPNTQMKTITKLDIDADGYISITDLQTVIGRYMHTAYFKYDNTNDVPNITLFPNETLSFDKVKSIVSKIKQHMQTHNISVNGLFNMIDKDNDGLISNVDFNKAIDTILTVSQSIKDQLFNYIDYYHNGLVDLETFTVRFRDHESENTLVLNDNDIEMKILYAFDTFINKNSCSLCDVEIFNLMDKDNDGLISIEDMQHFAKGFLEVDERDLQRSKLERVLERLSLTKNKHVGLNDIKTYMNETKAKNEQQQYSKTNTVNECDVLQATTNQNVHSHKTNTTWINSVIERFGLFVSEMYPSIEDFFNSNTNTSHNGKFTFDDFVCFHDNNYKCFNNGFNLTKDELLAVYTSLDSHKKNYLTLNDLETKLNVFDFYKKMHNDIKRFLMDNFTNGVDAFKMFINTNETTANTTSITHKDFFNAINYFFPNKYSTQTILRYLSKYFTPNTNEIHFNQFNYLYYGSLKSDSHFLKHKYNDTTLHPLRCSISNDTAHALCKTQSNFISPSNKLLQTPFDVDPLLKLKRIVNSSKYDIDTIYINAKSLSYDGKHLNKFQFRNLLRQLNIGLTNSEVNYIIRKLGVSNDGNINLHNFISYIKQQDPLLTKSSQHAMNIINEFKQIISKYYTTPLLCYQMCIKPGAMRMDFETFKRMLTDVYNKDNRQTPNYTQMKIAFDVIDLRKDGMIDMNEWVKTFSSVNIVSGSGMNVSQEVGSRIMLREWEMNMDMRDVYKVIWKHKQLVKNALKRMTFTQGGNTLIQPDNLVSVLKELLPQVTINNTQWKMVAMIGKNEVNGLVDVNVFFKVLESSVKSATFKPRKQFK